MTRNYYCFRGLVVICLIGAFAWIVLQLEILNRCMLSDTPNSLPVYVADYANFYRNQVTELFHLLPYLQKIPSCYSEVKQFSSLLGKQLDLPTIFVITPTYTRPVQKAELTRLSHTFRLVPELHWIVVEDSNSKSDLVSLLLEKSGVQYTHLNISSPAEYKYVPTNPNWLKPRGVLQRNLGLQWVRENVDVTHRGVVYFADDDNTYDLDLFEEMRFTRKVSVWPVALVGGLMVEKPIVKHGRVIGWNTIWKRERPFPIDMSGFAINVTILLQHPEAKFKLRVPRGFQESELLKCLISVTELEPKADNCTKVLVWHTRTEKPKLKQEKKLSIPSNFGVEV